MKEQLAAVMLEHGIDGRRKAHMKSIYLSWILKKERAKEVAELETMELQEENILSKINEFTWTVVTGWWWDSFLTGKIAEVPAGSSTKQWRTNIRSAWMNLLYGKEHGKAGGRLSADPEQTLPEAAVMESASRIGKRKQNRW